MTREPYGKNKERETMSYNVLRVTRACMLASITGVTVGYSPSAFAQVKDFTIKRTSASPSLNQA